MFSCSPAKRLDKLLTKHPELAKNDTIIFTDTLVTDQVFTDTIVKFDKDKSDTIYLSKDKLKVKVITKLDSIYISGECISDTIINTKEVIVEKLLPCPPQKERTWWEKVKDAAVWIIAGMAIMILIGISRR